MILNQYGINVEKCWLEIPTHFPHAVLNEFVAMPNHVYGIIIIESDKFVGNKNFCSLPWQEQLSRSLSSIIRGFKIGVTKYCHENNLHHFAWQKSFYDHIIRNEKSYYNIKQYIMDNPKDWEEDELYLYS